jgi:hypothetical protein
MRAQKSSGRGGAGNIHLSAAADAGTHVDSVPLRAQDGSPSPARVRMRSYLSRVRR